MLAADGFDRRKLAMRAYEVVARVEGRIIGAEITVLTPRIIAAERDLAGHGCRSRRRRGDTGLNGSTPALA